jgi:DNA-binding transcriptional regulator GbsR (MarR family)
VKISVDQWFWVKGDRKDYYEANDWFGKVLKNILNDSIAKRFTHRAEFYEEIEADLSAMNGDADTAFLKDRIGHLKQFESKAQKVLKNPVVRKLLT